MPTINLFREYDPQKEIWSLCRGSKSCNRKAFARPAGRHSRGVTYEIAGEIENDRLVWRLSLVLVSQDGPFSAFEGLELILTVVEGAGMDLDSPEGSLAADPLTPCRSAGSLAIEGHLRTGPVRNLNLIYDPRRVRTQATFLAAQGRVTLEQDTGEIGLVYVAAGRLDLDQDAPIQAGAVILFRGDDPNLRSSASSNLIHIGLRTTLGESGVR